MSTMITQCSLPVEGSDNEAVFSPAENTASAEQPSPPVQGSDQPCENNSQEKPPSEEQEVPPKEPLIKSFLPVEMKGTVYFSPHHTY